jgi:hypothetical protein
MSSIDKQLNETVIALGTQELQEIGFDPAAYIARYADVARFGRSAAARHYLTFGVHEGRLVEFTAPLSIALQRIQALSFPSSTRTALARSLASSRVHQVRADESWHGLAEALVHSDEFRPLLAFGDSHVRLYHESALLGADGGAWLALPFTCWAGSARGLVNPHSRSGYGARIIDFIRTHADRIQASGAVTLMKFGQVDLEFSYTFRRLERTGMGRFNPTAFHEFIVDTVALYAAFLERVQCAAPHRNGPFPRSRPAVA